LAGNRELSILQVCTSNRGGGAERVASMLTEELQLRGYSASLAVGFKRGDDAGVIEIPNEDCRHVWARFWLGFGMAENRGGGKGGVGSRGLRLLAEPARSLRRLRGIEDFDFPGSRRLLELPSKSPDIVHAHNLHGDYFDLRVLPVISERLCFMVTLHDQWMFSGHCAHSFDCERWRSGCGRCPDLTIYPRIRRDMTAYNWRRKREIYAAMRLYLASPSNWLLSRVYESILAPAIVEARVIRNGVDLKTYLPGDKRDARRELGIPVGVKMLLFAAQGLRTNPFKDYATLESALMRLGEIRNLGELLFVGLGDNGASRRIGGVELRFVPFQSSPAAVARYYQAADMYVHAARAEVAPLAIAEAMACGTPVVASAVGGIPEQVKGLRWPGARESVAGCNCYAATEANGLMVPAGDPRSLADALKYLLADDDLRAQLGANASRDAAQQFDQNRQVSDYLAWYRQIGEVRKNGRA